MRFVNQMQALQIRMEFEGFTPTGHKGLVRMKLPNPSSADGEFDYDILYTNFDPFQAHYLWPCFDETRFRSTISMTLEDLPLEYNILSLASVTQKVPKGQPQNCSREFHRSQVIPIRYFNFILGVSKLRDDYLWKRAKVLLRDIESKQQRVLIFEPHDTRFQVSQYSEDIFLSALRKVGVFLGAKFYKKKLKIVLVPGIGHELEVTSGALLILNPNWFNHNPSLVENMEETTYYVAAVVVLVAHQWFGYMLTMQFDHEKWLFEGLAAWTSLEMTDEICEESCISYKMLFYRNQKHCAMIANSSSNLERISSSESCHLEPSANQHSTIGFGQQESSRSVKGRLKLDGIQMVKTVALINHYEDSCSGQFKSVLESLFDDFTWKSMKLADFESTILDKCTWASASILRRSPSSEAYLLIKASIERPDKLLLSQATFLSDYIKQTKQSQHIDASASNSFVESTTITILYVLGAEKFTGSTLEIRNKDKPKCFTMEKQNWWIKINTNGRGYYRVLYTDSILQGLGTNDQSKLSDLDSLNLLDDALAIFKSGLRGSYYLVDVMRIVADKSNELIRDLIVDSFLELKTVYTNSYKISNDLGSFAFQLYGHEFLDRRFSVSDLMTKQGRQARGKMYEILALYEFEPLKLATLQVYRSPQLAQIHKDLHGAILITIARFGTDEEINQLLAPSKSVEERNEELDSKIFIALALSKNSDRFQIAWAHLITHSNRKLIFDYVIYLFETAEGESFAISTVLPELTQLYRILGEQLYLNLIRNICAKATDLSICGTEAKFIMIISDSLRMDSLRNSYAKERLRRFYLQQLDINKLVL